MKAPAVVRRLAVVLVGLLVVPPIAVAARQLVQIETAANSSVAKMAASHELYAASEANRRHGESGTTLFSMTAPEFLKCDVPNGAAEDKNVAESLMLAFIADARWRSQIEIERYFADRFSAFSLALMTGCVEASIIASQCADYLLSARAKAPKTTDPRMSDAARAAAYCAGVKGLNAQGAPS